jgi:hypothetical protein
MIQKSTAGAIAILVAALSFLFGMLSAKTQGAEAAAMQMHAEATPAALSDDSLPPEAAPDAQSTEVVDTVQVQQAVQAAPLSLPTWEEQTPEQWSGLVGDWVSAAEGDAVRNGKLWIGGARVELIKARPDSKTPWNVRYFVPTDEHDTVEKASGGCGFYPSGKAFCRGYGQPKDAEAIEKEITITRKGDLIRLFISGWPEVELARKTQHQ